MNEEIGSLADQKLSFGKSLSLGFQHLIIAVLAAIPVPLIVSKNAGLSPEQTTFFISAIIFTAGICTILASLNIIPGTSPRIPMVMGASFAVIPIATSLIVNSGSVEVGFRTIAGATMVGGLMCFLLAKVWAKLDKLFPPLVIGTNLLVLSAALLPNAFHWMMADRAYDLTNSMSPKYLYLALGVFLFHIIISKFLKGFLGNLTVLIAIIVGTIAAWLLGMLNADAVAAVKEASWFGLVTPFHFGLPIFEPKSIISICIVTILTMVEVSGTSIGIHSISKKKMSNDQFVKVLRTTGINTILSGGFNSFQPTSFAPSVGILELSQTPSRFATASAGIMLLLVGLIPKIAAVISAIPTPVLGGVGLAIFGVIMGSAIDILKAVEFNNNNKLIVGLSVGVAMIPAVYPGFYSEFPQLVQDIFGSGVLAGSIVCIVLNIFFNFKELTKKEDIAE